MTDKEFADYLRNARTMTAAECAEVEKARDQRNGVIPANREAHHVEYGPSAH